MSDGHIIDSMRESLRAALAEMTSRAERAERERDETMDSWTKARDAYEDSRAANAGVLRDLLAAQARLAALEPVISASKAAVAAASAVRVNIEAPSWPAPEIEAFDTAIATLRAALADAGKPFIAAALGRGGVGG